MQRYEHVGNLTQNFRSEMEPGRRRSHRAARTSKNRLVSRHVVVIARPVDVWRQRHGAAGIRIKILIECDDALAIGHDFLYTQNGAVDLGRCADAHFPPRLNQAFPTCGSEPFQKQKFNRAIVRESSR